VRLIASEEDLNTSICRLGFNFITFITQSNKSCRFDSCIVVKTKSEVKNIFLFIFLSLYLFLLLINTYLV
jgi:hypothetical protein